MSKIRLIDQIAATENVEKTAAERMIDTVFGALPAALGQGKVIIPGFGIFDRVVRKGKMARNPRTGEPVRVADKTITRFRDTVS